MKELRFKADNGAEIWRADFAFVLVQQAIMLVAADKQGSPQARFYKNLLKIANSRYERVATVSSSATSLAGSIGLTKWWSKPAAVACWRASSSP